MDKIAVLDFGGQYSHLIARRVREIGVYSEVRPPDSKPHELTEMENLRGVILSGGAASVYEESSPRSHPALLELDIPILGICYGHQLIAYQLGGDVHKGGSGEYGNTDLSIDSAHGLLTGLSSPTNVWMNHKDRVSEMPDGFQVTGFTSNSPVAVFQNPDRDIYGVQFHPEVTHTEKGTEVLGNFVRDICGARPGWKISDLSGEIVKEAQKELEGHKVMIGLSGGVDSSTAAALVDEAIGEDLIAVFVDTGLMRKKEKEFLEESFLDSDLDMRVLDRKKDFFQSLEGVRDPERKREIVGKKFIDIFEEIAKEEEVDTLVQGTIYSDRIESGITKHSDTIKSHHNVGGLPKQMQLDVYEPLRNLYKDEVRELAREIGLSEEIISRHVFPGPGLAIRIIGEVTPEKAKIVRESTYIVEDLLRREGLYEEVWMAFTVLLSIRSVGIQGDVRSYKYPLVLRVVESEDAMTANFARLPYSLLEEISTRITNEIDEVNRVVYDISNKPPSTMEWE